MGLLVDGVWHTDWYDTGDTRGRFIRSDAVFRRAVTRDGSSGFPAESGRYHLYVSYACPWAHRVLVARSLKGLEEAIPVSVVEPDMLDDGWVFSDALPDGVHGARFLRDVYRRAAPTYSGRVTVPVLWDTQSDTIVNNESSEILRMFDDAFHRAGAPRLYPAEHADEIDAINAWVYDDLNNGVYKAGFATTQEAYDEAVEALFAALERLEGLLEGRRFLVSEVLTEADVRLFTTLVRFDPVYHVHFKCTRRRLRDYPNLWRHTRRVYQIPGVAATVRLDHIRRHYYYSHETLNPHRIVPLAPDLDYDEPVEEAR